MIERHMVTASIGKRFSAQFIDEGIAFFFGYIALLLLGKITQYDAIPIIAMWAIVIGYTLIADGMFGGQSIGKKLMKLYVVRVGTNEPCSYGRSILRNVTYILGIIDLIPLVGKQKRRLGDYLADTKVIMEL